MHHDEQGSSRRDEEQPNRESHMEPAEGSRQNTNVNPELAGNQGGRGTSTMKGTDRGNEDSELPPAAFGQGGEGDEAGGISNRPLEEEQGRQQNLPPRGERRETRKED